MAGLYVHVPFRQDRCSHDDACYVAPSLPDESRFVTALSREIDHVLRPVRGEPITTVYVGGGRPSLLSLEATRTLLHSLRERVDGPAIEETTVELSPADASPRYLEGLRRFGGTRLSIEGLSFVPATLTAVGASHSVDELVRTVQRVRQMEFERFSVDLLFGGPAHSLSTWKTSLQRAVDLRVPHVALRERAPNDDRHEAEEERAECLAFAMTFLKAKGYEQYELTHFARPNHRSCHQQNYYAHGNYLGLGPGAESFWWPNRSAKTTAQRWSNVEDPEAYVERLRQGTAPVAHRETLDRLTLAQEYVLLRLRTNEGLDLDVLETEYGVDLRSRRSSSLSRLAHEGLIYEEPDRVRLTNRGRLLTDAITERLLPT